MNVLLLGARAPAALEWARAFAACGWTVHAADSLSWTVTRASRAVTHYHRLPEPRYHTQQWLSSIAELVRTHEIDWLIPTCEEVFYLGHGLEHSLSGLRCHVAAMSLTHLRRWHDKFQFARMTESWEVAAPETHLLESPERARDFLGRGKEWVFKPVFSRFATDTLVQPNDARISAIHPNPERAWVAQRYVAGTEYCSYSVLHQGRLRAHACYQPRYRVGRGSGIWFDPHDPTAIRDFVTRFGRETGYTGQLAFDFICDAQGRFHVLECNPRATSGVHLFDDQPQALVRAMTEPEHEELITASKTPRMVAFAMCLFAGPGLWAKRSTWRDFAAARDVITQAHDRTPLLMQIPALMEISGRAFARRCSLLQAATADIEWDGGPMEGARCA